MKLHHILALAGILLGANACSKHDCDLASEADKAKFGEVAEMTGGAHSCMVSGAELIATHPDMSIDEVAKKYEGFLASKSWEVKIEDYASKRANGKDLEGKLVVAKSGDKELRTVVYPLTPTIIETVTTSE